jgi:hypothetical protein
MSTLMNVHMISSICCRFGGSILVRCHVGWLRHVITDAFMLMSTRSSHTRTWNHNLRSSFRSGNHCDLFMCWRSALRFSSLVYKLPLRLFLALCNSKVQHIVLGHFVSVCNVQRPVLFFCANLWIYPTGRKISANRGGFSHAHV